MYYKLMLTKRIFSFYLPPVLMLQPIKILSYFEHTHKTRIDEFYLRIAADKCKALNRHTFCRTNQIPSKPQFQLLGFNMKETYSKHSNCIIVFYLVCAAAVTLHD